MSTNKFKLEVGKFYNYRPEHYIEIVYQDPSDDYVAVVVRLFATHERSCIMWWDGYTPMEEIPNPRMTVIESFRSIECPSLVTGTTVLTYLKPDGSLFNFLPSMPDSIEREDAPFDTDGEDEEDGCGSDEEYLDNLLEEEKKRFQLEIGKKYTMSNHPVNKYVLIEHYVSSGYYALCFYGTIVNNSGTCSGHFRKDGTYAGFCDNKYNLVAEYVEPISGSALAEILLRIDQEEIENKKICQHEWVDTGFHKSWCKKCDANKPEGDKS